MMDTMNTPGSISMEEMKRMPLHRFFLFELKDMYWAENHLVESMPDMIDAATSDQLKMVIGDHLSQTQGHVQRLNEIFEALNEKPEETKCKAMSGILKEANDIIDETEDGSAVRDAAIILAAQKIEHYEIASYGSLLSFSDLMGHSAVSGLLSATLEEEKNADLKLSDLAEREVNKDALNERD